MEIVVRIGLVLLALLHVLPSLVFFSPALAERLYDVSSGSNASILIIHRGALFGIVCLTAVWAVFDPAVRILAMTALAISMASFLYVFWQLGLPTGPLRTIALADIAGLVVLASVVLAHIRTQLS